MGDQLERQTAVYKRNIVTSSPKAFPLGAYNHIVSSVHGTGLVGQVAIFLLKVAALETVRRVSRSKCPHVWNGLQALQLLCYPPFKWIKRWAPFKGLVKGVQMFSRPLLVLSVATAIADQSNHSGENSNGTNDSHADSETCSESLSAHSSFEARISGGVSQSLASENWLIQLLTELENQGIALPERIDEDELCRFYTAANGDFSCLLLSIKKTVRWRETYRILSQQELEMWSNMVFWHGLDVQNRPCLIVRLGLACINLSSHDRPRFAQAIISQVEYGVLHLVDEDSPQITVLVDCDGISPSKIPMQMMRSCALLLQDNFPNSLGLLLAIRLPAAVQVIAQTFIQVLKPVTRKKLRIEGNMNNRVLSRYLKTLPSYFGGNCTCEICSDIHIRQQPGSTNEIDMARSYFSDDEDLPSPRLASQADVHVNDNWNHLLRTLVIGILMFVGCSSPHCGNM
ncbi:SEC14 CYTOSOLIC FACTOR FAMILY PROTEIN / PHOSPHOGLYCERIDE TRANSFER FAMILY PROTEIN [Salix koriyanagi]|uniref:SEC14 CYTOSOLIC FACTOR FAMILY PROTEIN / PHOSPHOGLYCERIDE TRANSFER FAMILY PROTEIN n=1 Tax=Salix koriyanagi TaxID=2511006 RepID=A0A9Q0TQC1_9ROSI|nr:SEC14 CYTOSOLIC FACTOR FAMILY PROTEIN / PHOSPHOGLYCERIDE TRANSFER FAMILY PROTEIN [Salix koriyanagi]